MSKLERDNKTLLAEKEALLRQIQQQHEEITLLRKEKLYHSTERVRLLMEAVVKDSILDKMIARL